MGTAGLVGLARTPPLPVRGCHNNPDRRGRERGANRSGVFPACRPRLASEMRSRPTPLMRTPESERPPTTDNSKTAVSRLTSGGQARSVQERPCCDVKERPSSASRRRILLCRRPRDADLGGLAALLILGRIAGQSDEAIQMAWARGEREGIINAALKRY